MITSPAQAARLAAPLGDAAGDHELLGGGGPMTAGTWLVLGALGAAIVWLFAGRGRTR